MAVIVTGGTGYLGQHLVQGLAEEGYQVCVVHGVITHICKPLMIVSVPFLRQVYATCHRRIGTAKPRVQWCQVQDASGSIFPTACVTL